MKTIEEKIDKAAIGYANSNGYRCDTRDIYDRYMAFKAGANFILQYQWENVDMRAKTMKENGIK